MVLFHGVKIARGKVYGLERKAGPGDADPSAPLLVGSSLRKRVTSVAGHSREESNSTSSRIRQISVSEGSGPGWAEVQTPRLEVVTSARCRRLHGQLKSGTDLWEYGPNDDRSSHSSRDIKT